MKLTFRDYVRQRRVTNTPAGDFTRDVIADREFPDVKTFDELKGYMLCQGACREAINAARVVWHRYNAYLRRCETV